LSMANDVTREPIGWKPIALDGGYGWVVVFGSFLIHVFADGFVYSFGVIAESLVKEFNASNAETSVILSLLTGLMLAAGPVASAICNRIGCRVTTIIGAVIASIGCALSYFATSMTYLIFSVGIIMGTGFGLMYCPAIIIVTMYFEKYRSLATGVTVCGAGVGTFVFSKIIGYLIVTFDWQTVFIIYAAVVLLCVPCGALYRPIEFEPIYADDERMNAEEETAQELANGTTDAYREKLASVASAPERRTTSVAEVLETVVDDNTATSPNETLHTFIDDSKALLSPPKGTNGNVLTT
jgi:MFS family permease